MNEPEDETVYVTENTLNGRGISVFHYREDCEQLEKVDAEIIPIPLEEASDRFSRAANCCSPSSYRLIDLGEP